MEGQSRPRARLIATVALTQRRSLVNVIGTWQEQSRECDGERLAECDGRLAGEGALYERMTDA